MPKAPTSNHDDARKNFEARITSAASVRFRLNKLKFSDATPSIVHAQLSAIDVALTTALQTINPLCLEHRTGQDLELEPFNFRVTQELSASRVALDLLASNGKIEEVESDNTYPSSAIRALVRLRDAARHAAAATRPKPGNSPKRTARSAQLEEIGRDFVFSYRAQFGHMPPMSGTGWVVELLARALDIAGLQDVDAADVLRASIAKDPMRRQLPSARSAKAAARRAK